MVNGVEFAYSHTIDNKDQPVKSAPGASMFQESLKLRPYRWCTQKPSASEVGKAAG